MVLLFLIFISITSISSKTVQFPLEKQPLKSLNEQAKDFLPQSHSFDLQNLNSVWVTQIILGERNVIPMAVMLYTNETWVSSIDKDNVKSVPCTTASKCSVSDQSVNMPFLTYNVTGKRANIQQTHFIYASDFDYTPDTLVSGGLGLGIYSEGEVVSYPLTFEAADPIFSMYLSRNFIQSSNIMFGGYDSQYIIFNARFQRINTINKKEWTFQLSRIADQSLSAKAVLDPNLPYIGIPEKNYEWFLNNFTSHYNLLNCNYSGISPLCDCTNFKALPSLSFVLGGSLLELPPSIYTSKGSLGCHLLVTKVSSDNTTAYNVTKDYDGTWVLGEPFMAYYYMVFYAKDGYVNVAPSKEISTTMAAWIIMILLCSFGFIGIVLYRCYQLSPKKLKEEKNRIDSKSLTEKLIVVSNNQRQSNAATL